VRTHGGCNLQSELQLEFSPEHAIPVRESPVRS